MEKLLILFYLDRATGTTSNVGFIVFVQLSLAPATDWVLRYRLRVMPTMTDMAGPVLATAIPIPFEKFVNSKPCPDREEKTEVVEVIAGSDVKEKDIMKHFVFRGRGDDYSYGREEYSNHAEPSSK